MLPLRDIAEEGEILILPSASILREKTAQAWRHRENEHERGAREPEGEPADQKAAFTPHDHPEKRGEPVGAEDKSEWMR
jgi:hypothetical protein